MDLSYSLMTRGCALRNECREDSGVLMNHIFLLFVLLALLSISTTSATQTAIGKDTLVNAVDDNPGKNSSTLLILLHGYTLDGNSLRYVQSTFKRIPGFEDADVLRPNLPLDTFSMAASSDIVAELILAIDQAWEKHAANGTPYERIIIVGHSMGGLFARKIYAAACGENEKAPFEKGLKESLSALGAASLATPRPWAKHVDRIVLLAGMNRGWKLSHHMSVPRAITMQMGVAGGYLLEWFHGRQPVIFTIRQGSPFITNLRLQWLSMREYAKEKKIGNAVTVQLLGTVDDLVSPDDNIDLVSGKDFVYLEVPLSGHRNVIDMDDSEAGKKRQEAFIQAFHLSPRDTIEFAPLIVRRDVTDVVFVIHGIRDEGYWTRKIARRVQRFAQLSKSGRIIVSETSSYGYFPMLSFLTPGKRQEKVEWLMDRYTEARAKYPEANFHFIGHSNGTYLLAKALKDYSAVQFKQVVFAGSVVQRDYKWHEMIPDRVHSVLNFMATADWVVAFFPKALQSVGIQDLGSAGHDGFDDAEVLEPPQMYIIGGHSAALQEAMWDSIAEFTITGHFQPPPAALQSKEQAKWVSIPAQIAPLLWLAICGALVWILHVLIGLEIREWVKTTLIITYITMIWMVLTKV